MGRLKAAIEGAGGSDVWVKTSLKSPFPPARADQPVEAVAVPPAFDAVLSRIQKESAGRGFEIEARETRTKRRARIVEVRVLARGELVGRWRLREVARMRRAAIVMDDLGQDRARVQKLLELPYPITWSVLPLLPHSVETAEAAHRAGREVMLHQPMQAQPGSPVSPGLGEVKVGMSGDEVTRVIARNLASVPYSVGVNNHMGSRATADAALMAAVMKDLAERHLYFVDSRTTAATVALDLARRRGVPAFYRSVFLDDTETVPYTLGQLRAFRRAVEEQGAALAIGHPHPTTLTALAQFLPELEQDDIQLVPVSELVRLPEVARLSPPRAATGQKAVNSRH